MGESVVGSRIESEDQFGTVLYSGPVTGTKGEWLGVDWDDPKRGKHNGSHEGVQYFTTSLPTSGSFIRPKKATFGRPFLDALQQRYGRIEDESAGVVEDDLFVVGKNQQTTTVEFVGAQSVNLQQSQFSRLKRVVLRNERICTAGSDSHIGRTIPLVEELDLSKNLLPSWAEVAKITAQLPCLRVLHVSGNRLVLPDNPECLRDTLCHIETLYSNRVNWVWDEVLQCLSMMPNLKHLHVCFNRITELTRLAPTLERLTLLNLESNPLKSWEEVLSLGKLAHLETLILNATGLDKIEFPDVSRGQKTRYFPALTTLYIGDNKIEKLTDIDELDKLPKLSDLKIRRNPIMLLHDEETVWAIIVAKIAELKLCNRTEVTKLARRSSEFEYVRRYGQEWRSSGGHQDPEKNKPSAEFTSAHPRYQHFIDVFGAPEDDELKQHSSALRTQFINVTIECPQMACKKPLKKKLLVTMTLQKLKTILHRIYKIDTLAMKITYTSHQMPGLEIEMDSDQKEIGYYSVEEGDVIHVNYDE